MDIVDRFCVKHLDCHGQELEYQISISTCEELDWSLLVVRDINGATASTSILFVRAEEFHPHVPTTKEVVSYFACSHYAAGMELDVCECVASRSAIIIPVPDPGQRRQVFDKLSEWHEQGQAC